MDINTLLIDLTKDKKVYRNIYNNLNKEKYWVVMTDNTTNVWNFEHNIYSTIPNGDYNKIIELLEERGYVYCYNLPEKSNKVRNLNYE